MRTRSDYKICPNCGAALDVGEVCDCMEKQPRRSPSNAPKTTKLYKYAIKKEKPLERAINA